MKDTLLPEHPYRVGIVGGALVHVYVPEKDSGGTSHPQHEYGRFNANSDEVPDDPEQLNCSTVMFGYPYVT